MIKELSDKGNALSQWTVLSLTTNVLIYFDIHSFLLIGLFKKDENRKKGVNPKQKKGKFFLYLITLCK